MEKKNKNMVAVILKVYAIVNAIIGCIIGLSGLSDSYNEIFNMVYTIFLGACMKIHFWNALIRINSGNHITFY